MNNLKVLGKEHIGKYQFTGIEGGFGKDKKAMLVKDIAGVHGQTVGNINRIIKNNRKWFEDGIDIIDLLNASESFREFAEKQGLVGSNRTQHVYLLSELGYATLVKFMDDDQATKVYKTLVRQYFNMRQAIKENQPDLLKGKRLEVMQMNASTRKANLIYKIAMASKSDSSQQSLLAIAAKELTGEMTIPDQPAKEYSAAQVGAKLNLSANMVGRIAKKIGLKAEMPGQNEYGRWSNSKSKYSDKEVAQWLYTAKGIQRIKGAM